MSYNPFLKSNNRFNNLDDDNTFSKSSRRRRTDYDSNTSSNHFRRLHKENPVPVSIEINNPELFPDLSTNTSQVETSSLKFKDILTAVDTNLPKTKYIPDGWVGISKNKTSNELVYTYGKPIEKWKKFCKEKEDETDLNILMSDAIDVMQKNWDRYEQYYDNIHGEGSYDEQFRLPPVYDLTEDEEDDDGEYDDEFDEEDDNI